jgi:hypothetical protein
MLKEDVALVRMGQRKQKFLSNLSKYLNYKQKYLKIKLQFLVVGNKHVFLNNFINQNF